MSEKMYLILENGKVFKGESFGASKQVFGEVVFTTSMTGYLETLTDPSNFGKIIVQTFPLIGNYGVIPSDFESDKPYLNAYIVRNWCLEPSNFRNEGTLDTFLKQHDIVGVAGIDTRALTKTIRSGNLLGCVTSALPSDMSELINEIKNFKTTNSVETVSTTKITTTLATKSLKKVAVYDFGVKESIIKLLLKRGCDVVKVPYNTKANDVLNMDVDGVVLSSGPSDPNEHADLINEIKLIAKSNKPILAIGLGHQLLALANGFSVSKLVYGHRGESVPVMSTSSRRIYVTSQNHDYVVDKKDSCDEQISYTNANDNSIEGIEYDFPAISVQFCPEAAAGPLDTQFIFDDYVKML